MSEKMTLLQSHAIELQRRICRLRDRNRLSYDELVNYRLFLAVGEQLGII